MHIQTEFTIYLVQSVVDMLVARGVISEQDGQDIFLGASGTISQIKPKTDAETAILNRALAMLAMMDDDLDDIDDELNDDGEIDS